MTLLLDTHVLHWWTSNEHSRLSANVINAIRASDEIAVSSVSWFELAWLAEKGRITITIPTRTWLQEIASGVRTLTTTPAIAATAASLGQLFPLDPADRVIYATAIEEGLQLATRDERMRNHPYSRQVTIW